jgi:hypothetical protein
MNCNRFALKDDGNEKLTFSPVDFNPLKLNFLDFIGIFLYRIKKIFMYEKTGQKVDVQPSK